MEVKLSPGLRALPHPTSCRPSGSSPPVSTCASSPTASLSPPLSAPFALPSPFLPPPGSAHSRPHAFPQFIFPLCKNGSYPGLHGALWCPAVFSLVLPSIAWTHAARCLPSHQGSRTEEAMKLRARVDWKTSSDHIHFCFHFTDYNLNHMTTTNCQEPKKEVHILGIGYQLTYVSSVDEYWERAGFCHHVWIL